MDSGNALAGAAPVQDDEFEVFYMTTSQRTFDVARRAAAGDKHLANDAMQEAYLAMWRCWPSRRLVPQEANARYVRRIAVNKVADVFRQRRHVDEFDDEADPGETVDVSTLVEARAIHRAVLERLATQPSQRRAVGVLFFIEECSYEEIAEVLGIAVSTARTHVQRLRQQLRPYLVDGEDTHGRP